MTAIKLFRNRRGERKFRRLEEGNGIRLQETIDDLIIIGFSGVFSGDVVIDGNLTVNGTETTINSTVHVIADNKIVINDGEVGAGVVTLGTKAGLLVDRGSEPNVEWCWDETRDIWTSFGTLLGDFADPTLGIHVGDRDYNDARYLLETNNLSDLASAITSRVNLGVEIGVDVQAWDADLDTLAGLSSADSNFIVGSGAGWVVETGGVVRASLGLTIGVDVVAFSHVGSGGTQHATVIAAGASGFMTGTDKTKLNGIEDNAKDDQTAGEILTALLTVDGEGSLLDADLLDGSHASAFAPIAHVGAGGAAHANVIAAGDSGFMTGSDKTKLDGIEALATADQTAADIRGLGFFDITNDGAASGLDADLLDGSHASAFATAAQGTLADSALQNVVEDLTPQLGGQLDVNGNGFGDGANVLLNFVEDASAVNNIQIENEATGSGPIIRSVGADTNVDLNISSTGTGTVNITGAVTVSSTVDGRDLATDGTKLDGIASGADVSPVTSVFGRVGVVAAATSDYDDVQVDNTSSVTGATVKDALDTLGTDLGTVLGLHYLGAFTVATLPAAGGANTDRLALATDAGAGRTLVISDGTDWKVFAVEGAIVTA